MSDFRLNCERILATTRQHFFAGNPVSPCQHGLLDDDSASAGGEQQHREHTGA